MPTRNGPTRDGARTQARRPAARVNRVGNEARFFPGACMAGGQLNATSPTLGLQDIRSDRWQVDYDLVWARNASMRSRRPTHSRPLPCTRNAKGWE